MNRHLRPTPSSFSLLLSSAVVAVLVVAAPRAASALPTLRLPGAPSLARVDASGVVVPKRPLALHPDGINGNDCRADQRIRVALELGGGFEANATLGVWASLAGTDCSSQSARQGAHAACWSVVDAVPLQRASTLDVPVRRILEGALGPSAGGADPGVLCSSVERTALTLHALYFQPGFPEAAVSTSVEVLADTKPLPAPDGVRLLPGNEAFEAAWTSVGGGPVVEVASSHVYCTRSGAPSDPTRCEPGPLGGGGVLDEATAARLAVGRGTTSGVVVDVVPAGQPVENDVTYACAIALEDAFGNVGPASAPSCVTPNAGAVLPGQAAASDEDDGGCSVASPSSRGSRAGRPGRGALGLASAVALLALAVVTRGRRGARS